MEMLLWQNRECDIISIHLYDGRECYFESCSYNEVVIRAAAEAAASAHKQLLLGEYGPTTSRRYIADVLRLQVDAASAEAGSPLRAFTLSAVSGAIIERNVDGGLIPFPARAAPPSSLMHRGSRSRRGSSGRGSAPPTDGLVPNASGPKSTMPIPSSASCSMRIFRWGRSYRR